MKVQFNSVAMMLLITFALAAAACDRSPTLDFSSDEAAVASIQAISDKLSSEEQQRFKAAMGKVITHITNETLSEYNNMTEAYPKLKNRIHDVLHGKSAADIFELEKGYR